MTLSVVEVFVWMEIAYLYLVDSVHVRQLRRVIIIASQMATVFPNGPAVPPRVEVEAGVVKLVSVNQSPVVIVVRGAVVLKIAISRKVGGGVRMQDG